MIRVLPCGDGAVLVELADLDAVMALTAAVNQALVSAQAQTQLHLSSRRSLGEDALLGVIDVVPGARTVLIQYEAQTSAGSRCRSAVVRLIRDFGVQSAAESTGVIQQLPDRPLVTIPVVYDGPDLDQVADLFGLSRADVVARHIAADWVVAFTGFAPGFSYLHGGSPFWASRPAGWESSAEISPKPVAGQGVQPISGVPRRRVPRTEVPTGSVGLADTFTGIYPRASPGGWQLIGRTTVQLWDLTRDPPALLPPGTRVRFEQVG